MQPVNAHMFCRSVNADFDVLVPTFTPFTNIPSLYTARRSPQMGTWWWSSQTKLGMRMPGITLVNAPWHWLNHIDSRNQTMFIINIIYIYNILHSRFFHHPQKRPPPGSTTALNLKTRSKDLNYLEDTQTNQLGCSNHWSWTYYVYIYIYIII